MLEGLVLQELITRVAAGAARAKSVETPQAIRVEMAGMGCNHP
jgi:hypothetical protein